MKKANVIFQPAGKKGKVLVGKTVLEASQKLGIGIESPCGGERSCGKCKVRVLEGEVSPFSNEEAKWITESERQEGYRLACSVRILGDVSVDVPEESLIQSMKVRKEILQRPVEVNPAIVPYLVELNPPSLHSLMGDVDRLKKSLSETHGLPPLDIDLLALRQCPHVLREGNWKVTAFVWMEREILEVRSGRRMDCFGLAIDIGTTTLAGYLCHLQNGEIVVTHSMMNPQVAYGEDVISRINHTLTHAEGLDQLHRSIIEGLNQMIKTMAEEAKISPNDILELTVVGNTLMHHLFLGLDPRYLGVSPFPPVLHHSLNLKARDLGLRIHPSAYVHLLPIEAGFVGADNVGVLIAEEPYKRDEMVLIIDIGTNGELVLGNRNRLLSASCATGPALEGAHIQFGMRAAPGAIERVKIDPDTLEVDFKVIGEGDGHTGKMKARGLCGSGIIDAIAELYRCGVIEKSGRFRRDLSSPRLRLTNGAPEFVIAWKEETSLGKEITITQQDVRNVQLAKAALYAGAKLMMKKMGVKRPDKVILAGAFGSYIDPEKALVLGMFPDCDLKNVYSVGNAAGQGARMALLKREKRLEAEEIARKVTYMELANEPDFQKEFIEAMPIPHMIDPFFHLEGSSKEENVGQGFSDPASTS